MIAWPLDNKSYTAEPIGAFCGTRTRGVFSADDCFAVRSAGGFKITLSDGLAWLKADKYWGLAVYDKAEKSWTLPVGSGKQGRYFAVAIQYDKTKNQVAAVLKTGEYAARPQKPQPVRNAYYDEIIVATILQRPGAVEITGADITDERENEAMCGLMRDGVTGLPSEMLYTELRGKFDELYAELEGLLNQDIAGGLQLQINQVKAQAEQTAAALVQTTAKAEQTAAETDVFTATFRLGSAWAKSGGTWTQTVSCTGMQAAYDTEPPFVLLPGKSKKDDDLLRDALNALAEGRLETLDGQLKATLWAEPPTCDIEIHLRRAVI